MYKQLKISLLYDCNSGCPYVSETLSVEMSATTEIMKMESSTCFPGKDTCINAHLVTALPTSLEDAGYVETTKYTTTEYPG